MTTNPQERPEPTLSDVSATLNSVIEQIQELRTELETSRQELKEEVQRWDERFFEFARDSSRTSRTIIITAGSVVIFSPVLQALAPAIQTIVARIIGADAPQ